MSQRLLSVCQGHVECHFWSFVGVGTLGVGGARIVSYVAPRLLLVWSGILSQRRYAYRRDAVRLSCQHRVECHSLAFLHHGVLYRCCGAWRRFASVVSYDNPFLMDALVPGALSAGVKDLHVVPRLRMSKAIPPFLHTFYWCDAKHGDCFTVYLALPYLTPTTSPTWLQI
jgi:hypothetical protein